MRALLNQIHHCFSLNKFKQLYSEFRQQTSKGAVYKIINDDKTHEKITFLCCHVRIPFTCHVSEAVSDLVIVNGLLPEEACYLGIQYGLFLANTINSNKKIRKKCSSAFYLKDQSGRYKINYEDREGNICYFDSVNHENFVQDPRLIAVNANIIRQFDSIQACYIGILAGIKSVKSKTKFTLPVKAVKKHLRLLDLSV